MNLVLHDSSWKLCFSEVEVLPVTVRDNDCFLSNQFLQFYYLPIFDNRTFEHLFDMFDKLVSAVNQTWHKVNDSIPVPWFVRKKHMVSFDLEKFVFSEQICLTAIDWDFKSSRPSKHKLIFKKVVNKNISFLALNIPEYWDIKTFEFLKKKSFWFDW